MSRLAPRLAIVLLALSGLSGCTDVNIVYEQLQQPFNRYATRDTRVLAAAEPAEQAMTFLANGDDYYDYPGYYDPHDFYGPTYGPWYYSSRYNVPPLSQPYYYEIFLAVRVTNFPPPGARRTLAPGEAAIVFARLDEGTLLTRLVMEAVSAEAWWDGDRPAVTFEARAVPGDAEYLQKNEATLGPVQGRAVTLLLAGTAVRTTLVATVSQERVFQITKRFRELGIESLMHPPP